MEIPATGFSVVVFFVLVLPGLVFGYVDAALRGFRADDKAVDTRIVRSLVISAIFAATYLVLSAGVQQLWNTPLIRVGESSVEVLRPVVCGLLVLGLFVAVPAGVAVAGYSLRLWASKSDRKWLRALRRLTPYRSIPTAWDAASVRSDAVFVRVRMADGQWVGGLFAGDSYVSTYPEERDIFIAYQYSIDKRGRFGEPVPESAGVWVAVTDDCVVEWLKVEDG